MPAGGDELGKLFSAEALALSRRIRPLLSGRDPGVIGGTLADLVSLYIAGHAPDLREETEKLWIATMHSMIAPSEKEIEAQGKYPAEWRKQ